MKYLEPSKVKYIVVHCSDTYPGQKVDARTIDEWHRHRPDAFQMIGYHFVIKEDGELEAGRPLFYQGAHVGKYNSVSVGVCYCGGRMLADGGIVYTDTRTEAQKRKLIELLCYLKKKFPQAQIVGHKDLDHGKACPCFNAKAEYQNL